MQKRTLGAITGAALLLAGCGGQAAPASSAPASSAPAAASAATAKPSSSPAASTAAGGSAGASPAAPPATSNLQELVTGAQKEGQVTMVWSLFTGNGPKLADGFKKAYNLPNMNVNFTAGPPNMPQIAQQLAQETQAGRPAGTDLFLADPNSIATVEKAGGIRAADWSWATNIKKEFVVENGQAVMVSTRVNGVTYNTEQIKTPPQSLDDLLKPEFKGKIATTPYFAGWASLAAKEFLGTVNATADYVTKLSPQIGGLTGCGEESRIASGEFAILALDCGAAGERPLAAKGAPVSHQILKDWGAYQHLFLAVPKTATHPNAAMLMANYLLSREAQDLIWASDWTDLAELPGSHEKPAIDKETPPGTKFVTIDFGFNQENGAVIGQAQGQVQQILRKATSK
ncbi:MAG TPA: ABC transporter substrate-binding protein [Chloroflexota bacterium]